MIKPLPGRQGDVRGFPQSHWLDNTEHVHTKGLILRLKSVMHVYVTVAPSKYIAISSTISAPGNIVVGGQAKDNSFEIETFRTI